MKPIDGQKLIEYLERKREIYLALRNKEVDSYVSARYDAKSMVISDIIEKIENSSEFDILS